jgi:hypothetical protein
MDIPVILCLCYYLLRHYRMNLPNASTTIANSTTTVGPQMPPFSPFPGGFGVNIMLTTEFTEDTEIYLQ